MASVVDGLVVRVTGPNGESLVTDMVPSVGGTATAPSPGWLLRAAEASCVVTLIAMRAAVLGISLDVLEVTVDSESDDRGILGIDESVPAGPLSGRVAVRIAADGVPAETLEEMAHWGVAHCPVCRRAGTVSPAHDRGDDRLIGRAPRHRPAQLAGTAGEVWLPSD